VPKINVYLPDELADAVKDAGVPVSAICQRALEQAVRRVTAIRETTLGDVEDDDPTERLSRFTDRARASIRLGVRRARVARAPGVTTEHLLGGMLDEGGNLSLLVLRALEVEPEQVLRELERVTAADGGGTASRFTADAANALELAVTEATSLGHDYVGCEHLLLGLVAEPDGAAGRVLRSLGVEPRLARRAVSAALAGYVHLRAQRPPAGPDAAALLGAAVRAEVRPLAERLDRLEQHVGLVAP
jgi:ATP-dependent Clp protease ATP-binding subunit ClpC